MAKNKGLTFNTAEAKAKWASLQNSAGSSLTNIIEGKASVSDVQKVASTLNTMSSVAATVFREAVTTAQQLVVSSGQLVEQQSGGGLTSFERALNEALKPSLAQLFKDIQDVLELETRIQTQDIKSTMGQSFADLAQALPPKDLPTVNDLLANNDLIVEQNKKQLDDFGDRQSDTIMDRMFHLLQQMGQDLRSGKFIKGQRHIPNQVPKLADQALRLAGVKPEEESVQDVEVQTEGESTPVAVNSATASVSQNTEAVAPPESRESQILSRLESWLNAQDTKSNKSDAEQDKDEEDKADSWWKSFRRWIGGGGKQHTKSSSGFWSDLLKDLGSMALLTSLFDPQFWSNLTNEIEKNVTWDNFKTVAAKAFHWLDDKTSGIVNWVLNKLGLGGKGHDTSLTPAAQAQFNQMSLSQQLKSTGGPETQAAFILTKKDKEGNLTQEGRDLLAAADPATRAAYEKMKYADETFTHRMSRAAMVAKDALKGSHTADNAFGDQGPTTSQLKAGQSQRSSLTVKGGPVSNSVSNSNSTSVSLSGPKAQPSMALDPGETVETPGGKTASPRPAVQGAAPIGMQSFGYTQGTSDGLLLMNSTLLGH